MATSAPNITPWRWFPKYGFRSEHVINAPLLSFLQGLRQQWLRCYLATSQECYRTAYILHRMGFAQQFDGLFSSCHIGCMKNEPSFFARVLERLDGVRANAVLFWDDSPGNVASARTAGLHGEVYRGLADFEETMRTYLTRTRADDAGLSSSGR